jgi:tRNA threonylcarbamoyladenosine biosynthesis protein TsaB
VKLLAIDSATERLALAAVETADPSAAPPASSASQPALRRVETLELDGGASASRQALPALLGLLQRTGWAREDLDAIAFGQGPGGFTGLRTACSVAQGLACGLGVPVLAIDSLALVAEAARAEAPAVAEAGGLVWVAMDARMEEIYAAAYRWHAARGWQVVHAPCLVGPETLLDAWAHEAPAVVAGSALAVFGDRLPTGRALALAADTGRAEALARLAAVAGLRGEARPAAEALPVYLRDKVALTTREREALHAAKAAASAAAGGRP